MEEAAMIIARRYLGGDLGARRPVAGEAAKTLPRS
jgi:hypothetical protein